MRPGLEAALVKQELRWGEAIYLRLFKRESLLELWVRNGEHYTLFRSYEICYHSGTLGPKLAEGDRQSPEGFYETNPGLMNPWSSYHLSFNIGYPNRFDRAHGRTGSLIMIHGNCVSIGCYAMTDEGIEEIYALVDAAMRAGNGPVPVHVFPFPLTTENLAAQRDSQHADFWGQLKQGYDYFETHQKPPKMVVRNQKYVLKQ